LSDASAWGARQPHQGLPPALGQQPAAYNTMFSGAPLQQQQQQQQNHQQMLCVKKSHAFGFGCACFTNLIFFRSFLPLIF
jgi:CO dehydrogenase nickel-insertion accessory protein CooC1